MAATGKPLSIKALASISFMSLRFRQIYVKDVCSRNDVLDILEHLDDQLGTSRYYEMFGLIPEYHIINGNIRFDLKKGMKVGEKIMLNNLATDSGYSFHFNSF
jgi:hypothetical protein